MTTKTERMWSEQGAAFARMVANGRGIETIAKDAGCTTTYVVNTMDFARDHPPEPKVSSVTTARPLPEPVIKAAPTQIVEKRVPPAVRPQWSVPDKLTLQLAGEGRAEIEANWH